MGKARERLTIGKRIKDMDNIQTQFFGLIRQKISTPKAISQPAFGSASAAGDAAQGFLRTEGDSMIGPFAFFPATGTISAGSLDIGAATTAFSSRVIVNGEGAANDDLDTIANATFAGQILDLQPILGQTITVKHLTGNIRLATGADIALAGQNNLLLIFDSISNQWTNLAPDASATGGAGVGANTALSNLAATAVNVDIDPGVTNAIDLGEDVTPLRFKNIYSHSFDIFDFGEFVERVGDPAITANKVQLYAKDKAGTSALFFQDDAGTVFDLTVAAGGANTALSNLVATAINQSLDPDTDTAYDLGSSGLSWNDLNIDRIIFRHNDGILAAFPSIGRSSNALRLNSPTGNATTIEHNGVPVLSVGENSGTRIDIAELASGLRWLSGAGNFLSIIKTGSSQALITSLDGWIFDAFTLVEFANGAVFTALGGGIDMNANDITDTGDITTISSGDLLGFRDVQGDAFRYVNDPTVVFLDPSSTGWDMEMAVTGDIFNVKFGGFPGFFVNENSVNVSTGWQTILNDALSITHVTNAYIDMSDIVVPASPIASITRIFHDSSDGVLKVKKSGGSVVSLEAGGGGQNQTPILSDINYGQFDIENIKFIEGRDTGATGSFRIIFDANEDSDTYFGDDSATDTINAVAGNLTVFQIKPAELNMIQPINMNQQFLQFDEAGDPAIPPATEGRVFLSSATGLLSIRKDSGSIVSLEGSGGGNSWSDPVDANIIPDFDNTRDLGSASKEFRNLFVDGIGNIDSIISSNLTTSSLNVNGTANFNGPTVNLNSNQINIGNSSGDNVNINARINTSMIPDNDGLFDIGDSSPSLRWRDIFITGKVRSFATGSNIAFETTGFGIFGILQTDNITITGDLKHGNGTNDFLSFFNNTLQAQISVGFSSGSQASNTAAINNLLAALKIYGLIG